MSHECHTWSAQLCFTVPPQFREVPTFSLTSLLFVSAEEDLWNCWSAFLQLKQQTLESVGGLLLSKWAGSSGCRQHEGKVTIVHLHILPTLEWHISGKQQTLDSPTDPPWPPVCDFSTEHKSDDSLPRAASLSVSVAIITFLLNLIMNAKYIVVACKHERRGCKLSIWQPDNLPALFVTFRIPYSQTLRHYTFTCTECVRSSSSAEVVGFMDCFQVYCHLKASDVWSSSCECFQFSHTVFFLILLSLCYNGK